MAVNLSPVAGAAAQFFDNSGQVLTGGKLYTYDAGTTTPAPTYTNNAGVTAHPNPIVLDAAGRVPDSGEIWLADSVSYKFVLKDQNDVLIGTYDNLIGINSNFVNFTGEEEQQTATQGQTVFTLTTLNYQPATNNLLVFVNGSKQISGTNYVETSSTVITFVDGLNVGDVVDFCTATPINTSVITAAQVSYNQGDAGAVTTTVEAKLQEVISVKDFGAIGDGTTDDTAAFQYALAVGGTIYIPTGTYKITSALNIPSAVSGIYGDGCDSSVIEAQSCDGFHFASSDNTYYSPRVFEKFTLSCVGATAFSSFGIKHIGSTNPADKLNACHFQNLRISGFGTGAYFHTAWWTRFENNVIYPCTIGVVLEGKNVDFISRGNLYEYGAITGAVATSVGMIINASTAYTSGTAYPEDVQSHYDVIYAMNTAIKVIDGSQIRITHGDFDNVVNGVEVTKARTLWQIEASWIGIVGTTGYGIQLVANGGASLGLIRSNTISPYNYGVGDTAIGILIGTGQVAHVEGNQIEALYSGDCIKIDGGNGQILKNRLVPQSNSISIRVVNTPAASVTIIDGNELLTTPYIDPVNNAGVITVGDNPPLGNPGTTFISGHSTILATATTVTTYYNTLYGTQREFWPIAGSGITPIGQITNAPLTLGNVQIVAGAQTVTITCQTAPSVNTKVYWQVNAIPTIAA